jgi:hypothetical protein
MQRHRSAALVILLAAAAWAGAPAERYGVTADLKTYPQANPKETLASVLKAADAKRYDYLLAQLADPEWVDARVKAAAGGFKEAVEETANRLDPPRVKLLRRFLEEGELETLDSTATFRLKNVKDRIVRLHKQNNRWYLRHSNKP